METGECLIISTWAGVQTLIVSPGLQRWRQQRQEGLSLTLCLAAILGSLRWLPTARRRKHAASATFAETPPSAAPASPSWGSDLPPWLSPSGSRKFQPRGLHATCPLGQGASCPRSLLSGSPAIIPLAGRKPVPQGGLPGRSRSPLPTPPTHTPSSFCLVSAWHSLRSEILVRTHRWSPLTGLLG